jgi:hypothetical protein
VGGVRLKREIWFRLREHVIQDINAIIAVKSAMKGSR